MITARLVNRPAGFMLFIKRKEAFSMSEHVVPGCARCRAALCYLGITEGVPPFCPGKNKTPEIEGASSDLSNKEILEVAASSSRIEAEGYCRWTRVEETMRFARKLGFTRIGVAFCVGLRSEAAAFCDILEANGFEVVSVCCKVGGSPKEKLGLTDEEKINPGTYEAYCNPIAQARILDSEGCQLNVLVGLCVGHDSLFFKHSRNLTTVLVAKDRVTGHNPAAALYTSGSYYGRLKSIPEGPHST
jgi:uncharacterized metal-binding protein